MGASKQTIVIDAKVQTSLEGMDKLRKELKDVLENNKLELSTSSNLGKLVKDYDEARKQLDAVISKGFVTPEENKKSRQLSERVANIYADIVKSISKIENLEIPDLKKMFPSNFSAKTAKGLKEISSYYEKLGDKEVTLMGLDIANKELSNMETTLQNLQNKRTKVQIDVDIEAANKRIQEIEEKKKALQNEVYDSLIPKETRDSQGKTQRERDQEEVKKAQEVYDAAIQLRNNLKKSKARAKNQQDLADLELINKNERDELAANQLEKAQAKKIKEKLEREVSRRTGANPSRGKGYEAVEDKDIQAQYLTAVDNLERLRTETAEIKKKYKARREEVEERPKTELTQARKNAETQVEAAKQNLDAAKAAQKTNADARQIQEDIARQKAEKFANGEEVQGVSADKVEEQRQYNEQLKEQLQIQEQLSEEKKTAFKDQEAKDSSIVTQDIKIQKKKQDIKELENALTSLNSMTNVDKVFSSLEELGVNTDGIERTEAGLQQIRESLLAINSTTADNIRKHLQEVGMSAEDAAEAVEEMREGLKAMDDKDLGIKQQEREIENLQQSFLHFFSIGNAIELFKRTVRESIETVKELDAVMTETAVVTDFTVGDMWEKLPTYAKQASQLGASIKDLYSATTLYYQQGLDTNQAMSVGVETMKMARIANMESSDATKAMTAALRGFNMEINETSATRINDVYSELAAITAADTNQIATAMGKTASIASSANMEFETTAALLAQIIETTQEAPETAGTAMKTIIARFTEVKELFDEGLLTGEDEEGESIDINKIDTALKKVGISLKDFLRGEKGIDDIFLELASKWDSLDLATQRYIATTAAGSRQQSRFIAMMSNYDRTMELVNAANNSAGASQEQYEKTLESMDAKLQKLQNSWDTFVMNLANQDALKFGIDLLTMMLEAVNNLTQAFSGGNGLSKSLLSFATTFGALKLGKFAINFASEGLFDKKFIPDGKTLEQLTKGRLQSIFAGFQKGIKGQDFTAVFTETVFDEDGFKEAAEKKSEELQAMLDDKSLKKKERKKLSKQKQLLDDAAAGDVEAGEKAGIKPEDYEKTSASLTGVATAAMGASVAVNLLGSAFNALGYEKAGEVTSNFGTAVMGLGSAAAMTAPLLKTLRVTAAGLGWGIGIAAVVLTALPYVFNAIKAATPEGKLEAAKEATVQAGEAAEATASSYESLKNALNGLDSRYDNLNKMVSGTQQWKEAAHELNDEIVELIDKYPELAEYFEYKNGVMSKKKGADQEIDRLLKQDEIDVLRAKQIETQAKINEQTAERNILENYGISDAFGHFETHNIDNEVEYIATSLAQELALQIAEEGLDEQDAKNLFASKGLQLLDYDAVRSYGELLSADKTRYDTQIANNLKSQSQLKGNTSEIVQELDSNILADIREKYFNDALKQLSNLTSEDKDEYASLMGYRRVGDDYYNRETGEKISNIDSEVIKTALASARADDAAIAKIASITSSVTKDSISGRLLSEDGANLTHTDIKQLDGDFSKDNVEEVFGIDIDGLAKKAGAETEAEVEAFFNNIKQNIESAQDRIKDQRADLVASMNKYTKVVKNENNQTLSDLNANILRDLEDRYGEGFRDTLDSVFMALQRSGDDAIIGAGYGNFITKAMEEGTTSVELEKLSEFITDVNWSSPIEAAYQLNQELKYGSGLAQEFAKNMTAVEKGYLGAGSQMQYLIKSGDFEGIQEELNGILETSNEISAADVLDLADSYSSLNKMLKNTKTSAAGVAKALEAVTKGDIKVDQLTDAVLASLEGFDGLNSMIAELKKELEDFDPGIDENFASEFIAQASEVVNENLKKGAVGNAQIDKYLDYLFTENWDENLNPEGRLVKMEELGDVLKKNSENMSDLWGRLAQDAAWQTGLKGSGLGVSKDANGEITFTGYEGMGTQEQVNALVEASKVAAENGSGFEISEAMAKLMITDFKNYSRDYEYLMATNERDVQEISKKLYDDGLTHIDQSEIDTIELLNGVTGLEVALKNLGVQITSFYEKDGSLKQTKDLVAEMARVQGYTEDVEKYKQEKFGYIDKKREYVPSSSGHVTLENAKLDMSMIEQQLAELGLPQEAKYQIGQDMVDGFFAQAENKGETLEIDATLSSGTKTKLYLQAGDSLEQAYESADLADKNTKLADSIVAAFTDNPIPVKLETNKEDLEGLTTDVQTDLIPNEQPILDLLGSSNYQATVSLIPEGHANGIKNSSTTHTALVGEEGAELIERQDGTAYLSGMNGPEVTTIHAGDTVHTAEETKRIFARNKGVSIPRFEAGAHGYGDKSGGASSDNDKETWENPFDKLYNLVRKIDEELRQRERIERRYEKLLEGINASADKIVQVSREELAQLERERMLQEQLISGRKYQIDKYQEENADLMKYANVTQNERGEDVLRINWDLIDQVTDTEEGERIEEYVSQLEEWFDSLEEAEDALWDIEDAVAEIKERGKEEYFELEDAIKDALTQSYQEEIDKLGAINDSINDTNTSLIEAIQKSIDKQRQDRDNQRTEEDIAEKQRRLAYLQQDTSGANDLEILRLQEEISQEQEDYTDTLIDQKISELQQQNDEAARQREQQITLAQAQLDHFIESGEIWKEVYELIDGGLDKEHGLVRGSRLEEILRKSENFTGMSEIAKMEWLNETNNMIAQALAYLEVGRQLEDIGIKAGTEIEFTNKEGQRLTGIVDEEGNVKASDGKTYNNVFQGADGRYYSEEDIPEVEKPEVEEPKDPPESEKPKEEEPKEEKPAAPAPSWKFQGKTYYNRSSANNAIQGWEAAQIARATEDYNNGIFSKAKYEAFKKTIQDQGRAFYADMINALPYKTGGLADFTGPAWLDGTKARPELVLNARDTANFIQLKDILSSIMSHNFLGTSTATENNGDINYDIDINVETIGNDYDVEQVANKVKSMISENGRYRNNNAISLKR